MLKRVNEETLRQGQARDGQGSTATGRKISEIVAYQRVADMPSSKELIIQVRHRHAGGVTKYLHVLSRGVHKK